MEPVATLTTHSEHNYIGNNFNTFLQTEFKLILYVHNTRKQILNNAKDDKALYALS